MNLGFDLVVESDGPDRAEDAPTSASMREGARGELRRRPSTDEKKVKNRLRREAGFDGDEEDDLEVVEGRILAAMAQKGRPWGELQALATELEDIRSQRRTAALRRDEIDLADAVIHDHLTPVLTYVQHTAATDWIDTTAADEEGDEAPPDNAVAVEASLWFRRVSAAVKADRDEFAEQAQGMASRIAGAYGRHADAARRAFLDRVSFLHRQAAKTAADSCPSCGSTNLVTKDTKPKGGYVRACGECGTELPEVKSKTAEVGPDKVKEWGIEDVTGRDPLAVDVDQSLSDEDQAGWGESGLPVETEADMVAMDAEFWDDGQSHAVPSTRAPNVTGSKTAADDPEAENWVRDYFVFGDRRASSQEVESVFDSSAKAALQRLVADGYVRKAGDLYVWNGPSVGPQGDLGPWGASKTAADEGGGSTCSTCGDPIERDPAGEEPRTWHHTNGEKHDHEANPGGGTDSKESSFRLTEDKKDDDNKQNGNATSGLPLEPEGDDVDEPMWPWEIGEKKKSESSVTAGWEADLDKDIFSGGIDNVTKGMLQSVLNGLSPANREKFANMPLEQAVTLGWRLVSGGVPRAPSTFAGLEERFTAAVTAAEETPCGYTDDLGGQCVYAQGHSGPHRPQGGDDDARYQRAKDKFEQEKKGSVATAQQEQFRSTVQANLARMSEVTSV